MISTPLTLAALATSAVPGLRVVGSRAHDDEGYDAAVLVSDERELLVRVPRTTVAEVRQSGELLGLAALSRGAREELPFRVPETLGVTRAGDTRAVVSTFLPGGRIAAADLESDALLLLPIAEALAAIHRLPTALVHQSGLPARSAEEVRRNAARLVERAAETRLLPRTVHGRWLQLLGQTQLWDFDPTAVHGSFDADQVLVDEDRVVGVLGWGDFSVGDPAADLAWLLEAGPEVLDAVIARYSAGRGSGGGGDLRFRAQLHHELGVAAWLIHGVEAHDDAIVEDAVGMLDRLVDRLSRPGGAAPARRPASPGEAERILDEVPELPEDRRSETAEYEALDEDRAFSLEADFADDGHEDLEEGPPGARESRSDPGDDSADATEAYRRDAAEHATEPIDPLTDR
ncbi:phosphotransferase [Leucobacter weissii]|uniref:Phosphotransferase n=1 Tax=Leucobacter weissii TaxID=1983706 RepID=A0A939MJ13_9MICO|nr:phosphotransferase [Leucobacter weissii]MBO1901145.1 phosphotransferase [Leucobacter weissii]